jgi:nucleoside-diphosphate-sugar epimerase
MSYSIYGGTGILGSYFLGLYGGRPLLREQLAPMDERVLYLISTTSNSYEDPLLHSATNIDCLMKRLMACRDAGVKEFNFVSSWFVYGWHITPRKEDDCCRPYGLYSITKRCAEQLVIDFCSHYGMHWRILRLGNVYGGPDKSTGQRNVLHYVVQQLKMGRPVECVTNMSRDYIHIGDACSAISTICKEGPVNDIYNIGAGESVLFSQVITKCSLIAESDSEIIYREHREGEQSLFMGLDCSKLQALGFSPLISLEEGLNDLCTSHKFSIPAHFSQAMKSRLQLTA